ncbi:MAG: FtsX-like permease family protein [Candidatus Cloacimonetes bacterium]|jgi:putative ABC transport system permease protein|nr:FtsX-like permease family protein [Candidatus Cloacimonadota bacterium]MBT6994065.1 FtsX-like permease family protein [Candidatus Cloacimonadota bacterium]MBT7468912.1 FtsX-like permease family protein [Candidatus Cloacimonadota bacterium]
MAITVSEHFKVGFSDFWSRKVRSLVTVIGIILGTMSVIVILSLMNGINKNTLKWMMERGGLSKITVRKNWSYENPGNVKEHFVWKELKLIRSLIPEAEYFNPQIQNWLRFSYGKKEFHTRMYGVVPDFTKIEEWDVESGRFISEFDIEQSNNVVVIGTTLRDELFGNKNPIGKIITMDRSRLIVIGVMQHRFMKNNDVVGNDNALAYMNRRAFMPISTMIHKGRAKDNISSFTVKAKSPEAALKLRDKLEAIILNLRHRERVFDVNSAKQQAEDMMKNQKVFQIVFFFISIISLLVGGIVIANIMLASIQERTREIGIRIAVGARRFDIFAQFLTQTILVTTIGGILGIAFGLSLLDVIGGYLEIELIAGLNVIIISLMVSAGVGFIFGIVPAIIASKLNPVKALRYE